MFLFTNNLSSPPPLPRHLLSFFKAGNDTSACIACQPCPQGYERVGCGGASAGVCRGLPCSAVPAVAHASSTTTNAALYPSNATYTCDSGYELANASISTLSCGSDLLWAGALPECVRVACGGLTGPRFGRIEPANMTLFRFMDNASACT